MFFQYFEVVTVMPTLSSTDVTSVSRVSSRPPSLVEDIEAALLLFTVTLWLIVGGGG